MAGSSPGHTIIQFLEQQRLHNGAEKAYFKILMVLEKLFHNESAPFDRIALILPVSLFKILPG